MADEIDIDALVRQTLEGVNKTKPPGVQDELDIDSLVKQTYEKAQTSGRDFSAPAMKQSVPASSAELPPADVPDLDPAVTSPAAQNERSVLESFTGGAQRGWKSLLATPDHLQGIYAEATGDAEAAAAHFAAAQATEALAPQNKQEFSQISGVEDAVHWAAGFAGEQLPVIASLFTGAGTGAAAGNLLARGLMTSAGARALLTKGGMAAGAFGAGSGLETAGIGSELREATGSYHPEVAVTGGLAAGALEALTPWAVLRAASGGPQLGKSIAGAVAKAGALESATELSQESVALLAREYADPNYELFSPASGWRLAEAAAGGFLGGSVMGGAGRIIGGDGEAKGSNRVLSQEEIAAAEKEESSGGFLKWFRNKYEDREDPRKEHLRQVMQVHPDLDVAEAGTLLDTVGIYWATSGAKIDQSEAIGEFIEDKTRRYIHPLAPDRLLNSTDLEEVTSILPPAVNPADGLMMVDEGSLIPIHVTADLRDLPFKSEDPRVFVLPGTTRSEKESLLGAFDELYKLRDPAAQKAEYDRLLNAGLRVIPSYGASFRYTGPVKGKQVVAMPTSGRTYGVAMDLNKFKPGTVTGANTLSDFETTGIDRYVFPEDKKNLSEAEKFEIIRQVVTGVKAIKESPSVTDVLEALGKEGISRMPSPEDRIVIPKNPNHLIFTSPNNLTGPAEFSRWEMKETGDIVGAWPPFQGKTKFVYPPEYRTQAREMELFYNEVIAPILKEMKVDPVAEINLKRGHEMRGQGLYRGGPKIIDISMASESNPFQIMLHEVGHHVTMEKWNTIPTAFQMHIWNSYRRHTLAAQQDDAKRQRFIVDAEGGTNFHIPYQLSFVEYLAEHFRKWMNEGSGLRETLDKYDNRPAVSYVNMMKRIADRNPKRLQDMQPDFMMTAWIEWVASEGRERAELAKLETVLDIPANHPLVDTAATAYKKTLEDLQHLFPEGWQLTMGDPGTGNQAVTISAKKLMLISIAAMKEDGRGIIAHEAIHAVRTLFTEAEWSALVGAARKIPNLRWAITQQYHGVYSKELANTTLSDVERKIKLNDLLNEEMVAAMVQMRAKGASIEPYTDSIIDKLLILLRQIAWNLREIVGWHNPETVMRNFFRGEIARRDINTYIRDVYRRWSTDLESAPVDVVQAGPNLWAAKYVEKNDTETAVAVQYRFYKDVVGEVTGTPSDKFRKIALEGQGVGFVFLSHSSKGYEVDLVQVRSQFRRQGLAKQFYAHIQKDMGITMKPSGLLLADGYKMWQARDPFAVRYHVYDAVDEAWLSPNYLKGAIELYKSLPQRNGVQAAALKRYEALIKEVNSKAWHDPELEKMFKLESKGYMDDLAVALVRKEMAYNERSLTGEKAQPLGFEQAMTAKMEESKQRNARELKLEDPDMGAPQQPELRFARKLTHMNQLTPQQKARLKGSLNEADRIGWFSKYWYGIHQMSWRNPHIDELKNYVRIIEQWAAKVEQWTNVADNTARFWDKQSGLTTAEKNRFANLLFYLTEMNYRTAAEVQAKVIRRPTQAELIATFRQFQLDRTPNAMALYQRIESNFGDFLNEIERISAASIQRNFAGQRVNGVPSASEAKALAELTAEMALLRKKPYFPMTRFGEWTMTVRDPQDNSVKAFYAFESIRERNAYIATAAQQWRGMDIQVGRMPEEAMEFMGVPGPLLKRIKAELPGLTNTQKEWIDALGHQVAPEGSFRKRWLQRKETPGYSLDAFRVFANYFQTGSRYLARLEFKDLAQDQINEMRKNAQAFLKDNAKRMQIADVAQSHLKYMVESGRDWAKTRAFIAIWHLGFSPMAAAMNLTQVPMVTMPHLNALFGAGKALRALFSLKTARNTWHGSLLNPQWPGYNKAREELIRIGKIDAGQAPELASYASGNNLYKTAAGDAAARAFRTTSQAAMWMFQQAERFNRELTFTMAFKLAMENPNVKAAQDIITNRSEEIHDLITRLGITAEEAIATIIAKDAIDQTHGIYAPWARPRFMQNSAGQIILVFFTYVQMMLYALRHNPGRAQHLLMLLAVAGLMGLPGADDLDKIVEAVARKFFGKDWSPSRAARQYIKDVTEGTMFDKIGPDLALHGISRFGFGAGLLPPGWGAPRFDASANMSMGKLIPGLGEAAKAWGVGKSWNDVMASSTQQAAGAGFSILFSTLQFLASNPGDADARKWEKIMQRQMKAMARASRYYLTGKETTPKGARFVDFDVSDPDDMATIAAQFLGATPQKLSMKYEAASAIRDSEAYFQARKKVLYEQMFKAVESGDVSVIEGVKNDILKFNGELKNHMNGDFSSLGINTQRLMGSLRNKTRSRTMQENDLPDQKSSIPLYRGMQEMYPMVYEKKVR